MADFQRIRLPDGSGAITAAPPSLWPIGSVPVYALVPVPEARHQPILAGILKGVEGALTQLATKDASLELKIQAELAANERLRERISKLEGHT